MLLIPKGYTEVASLVTVANKDKVSDKSSELTDHWIYFTCRDNITTQTIWFNLGRVLFNDAKPSNLIKVHDDSSKAGKYLNDMIEKKKKLGYIPWTDAKQRAQVERVISMIPDDIENDQEIQESAISEPDNIENDQEIQESAINEEEITSDRGRRRAQVSYQEVSLKSKMRQGKTNDKYDTNIFNPIEVQSSKKVTTTEEVSQVEKVSTIKDDDTSNKLCKSCDTRKPLDQFHKNKYYPDGRRIKCKSCVAQYTKERKVKIKDLKASTTNIAITNIEIETNETMMVNNDNDSPQSVSNTMVDEAVTPAITANSNTATATATKNEINSDDANNGGDVLVVDSETESLNTLGENDKDFSSNITAPLIPTIFINDREFKPHQTVFVSKGEAQAILERQQFYLIQKRKHEETASSNNFNNDINMAYDSNDDSINTEPQLVSNIASPLSDNNLISTNEPALKRNRSIIEM